MMVKVEDYLVVPSHQYCEALTKKAAKNFYYGLKLLPLEKRRAMYALYAYMRMVDDIADGAEGEHAPSAEIISQRITELQQWREYTRRAIAGDEAILKLHVMWPAFAKMVSDYQVPAHLFDEMIEGQRQDLEPKEFKTFEELHTYCYRVASVVGLASLAVWGYTGGQETEKKAIDLGIAFQLTNILRDLKEDAHRGRLYLPTEELRGFGVTLESLASEKNLEGLVPMMRQQIERAREYYEKARGLEECISQDSRPTLTAMTAIYRGILEKIADEPAAVMYTRVSLSVWAKLRIGWRAMRGKVGG